MDPLGQLLSDELLELLRRGELRLRRPLRGPRQGGHRSTAAGPGRDFRDHRPYEPGDDLRRLDWRAAARSDRLVVRRTEADHTLGFAMLLDASGGMDYGEGLTHKWRHLASLAAALASLARRQGDPMSYALTGAGAQGSAGSSEGLTPSSSAERLAALADALVQSTPAGRGAWSLALERLGIALRGQSLVVLASDFLDVAADDRQDPDRALEGLLDRAAALRTRGHDLLLLQVLHRDELTFPWRDGRLLRFEDPRGARPEIESPGAELRLDYLDRMRRYLEALDRGCERRGLHLHRVATDASPAANLRGLLARLSAAGAPATDAEVSA